LNKDRRL